MHDGFEPAELFAAGRVAEACAVLGGSRPDQSEALHEAQKVPRPLTAFVLSLCTG